MSDPSDTAAGHQPAAPNPPAAAPAAAAPAAPSPVASTAAQVLAAQVAANATLRDELARATEDLRASADRAAQHEQALADARKHMRRLEVEGSVLDGVVAAKRAMARTMVAGLVHEVDLEAPDSIDKIRAALAERAPEIFADAPAATAADPAKLDLRGKTMADLTPAERDLVSRTPELYRQIRTQQSRRFGV